jgi:TatD DNase family protein
MSLVDTHTHLETFVRHNTLDDALARAAGAGVDTLVTVGTASDDWSLYRNLARTHGKRIRYTVGLHPCHVAVTWRDELALMPAFWDETGPARPVALGEIGLDRFHLPKDSAEADRIFAWQREAFSEGLALAKRFACPVVIHSRGAFQECVDLVDASGVDWRKVVFHCFVEGPAEMSALMERGGFGSFTGIVTYKSADSVREAMKMQGLDRLMLETDAPYLTPVPHRGKPNEPAFLRHTAEFAADVFGVSLETLAARTTVTAQTFFTL